MNFNRGDPSLALSLVPMLITATLMPARVDAQTLSSEYSLTATEVHTGTTTPVASPNGMFEPGESVLLQMTINFDPPVGTIVPTPRGPGPIVGFGGLGAQINAHPSNSTGTWTNLALAPGWFGWPGEVFQGQIHGISFGQFPPNTGPLNSQNPVENLWRCVWTPGSYEPRMAGWSIGSEVGGPDFGSLLVEYGTDPTTGQPLYTVLSIPAANASTPTTVIHIVPGPAVPAVFTIGLLSVARRRRKSGIDRFGSHPRTIQCRAGSFR